VSIQLRDVHKAFGRKQVLRGLTLDVEEGETVSVVGFSGAGKSVMLKHINGLLRPDRGTVFVDGLEVPALQRRELYALRMNIGYVFQFAALFDSMTVAENILMGLRKKGVMDDAEMRRRIAESLALVDLSGYEARYPAELSGGQRKRAGLARAIAYRPKYLLYDEPTSGLDPVTTTVIDRLIQRMKAELGVTSLVITHDMDSAYAISDRIAMLYQGRLVQVGTPEEIRNSDDQVVRSFVEGRPDLAHDAELPLEPPAQQGRSA
jgi:phospholipid/cholesterol/gamma-HCH transport system ATP-binding protein